MLLLFIIVIMSQARAAANQEDSSSDFTSRARQSQADSGDDAAFLSLNFPDREGSGAENRQVQVNEPLFPEENIPETRVRIGAPINQNSISKSWDIDSFQTLIGNRIISIFRESGIFDQFTMKLSSNYGSLSFLKKVWDKFFPSRSITLTLDSGEQKFDILQVSIAKGWRRYNVELHPIGNPKPEFVKFVSHLAKNLDLSLNQSDPNPNSSELGAISAEMGDRLALLLEKDRQKEEQKVNREKTLTEKLLEFQNSKLGKQLAALLGSRGTTIEYPKSVAQSSYLLEEGGEFERVVKADYALGYDKDGFKLYAQEMEAFTEFKLFDKRQIVVIRLDSANQNWQIKSRSTKANLRDLLEQCPSFNAVEKWLAKELNKLE